MITVFISGDVVRVATLEEAKENGYLGYENRLDWKSEVQVSKIAERLNEIEGFRKYVATDSGEYCWPRYDVIELPKVGDDVSYSFNGDSYPCGKIEKISESLRVITTTGDRKFYRRKQSGKWLNGSWALVQGHYNERNPHF